MFSNISIKMTIGSFPRTPRRKTSYPGYTWDDEYTLLEQGSFIYSAEYPNELSRVVHQFESNQTRPYPVFTSPALLLSCHPHHFPD